MNTRKIYYFLISNNLLILILFGLKWSQELGDIQLFHPELEGLALWYGAMPAAIIPFTITLIYLMYNVFHTETSERDTHDILDKAKWISNSGARQDNF